MPVAPMQKKGKADHYEIDPFRYFLHFDHQLLARYPLFDLNDPTGGPARPPLFYMPYSAPYTVCVLRVESR